MINREFQLVLLSLIIFEDVERLNTAQIKQYTIRLLVWSITAKKYTILLN
jgi:hypothetical protein